MGTLLQVVGALSAIGGVALLVGGDVAAGIGAFIGAALLLGFGQIVDDVHAIAQNVFLIASDEDEDATTP